MTGFFVDVGGLQQLASNLELIYNALDHASDDFNAFDDVIGSSDVHGALDGFVGGWKDGRKTIKDEIASLIDAVRGAAEDYEHNENEMTTSSTNAGIDISARTR